MKNIKSSLYTPDQITLAHFLADALEDQRSLVFYLLCAQKYPKDYILATLNHVVSLPDHSVRTTRARLFTNIIVNSRYNTHDDTRD